MSILTSEKCTACRRDSPQVSEAEIQELKPQVPDWTLVERETVQRLERVFRLRDFGEALSFTNRVGALAEAEGHHPAILTEWGQVTVTLWTHKIRGLHRNDFVMAAKIDSLAPHSKGTAPVSS
jgi:4a-hydroxytetrahydrobiopterin dehydratase